MSDNRVCTGACIFGKCPFEECIKHKQGNVHKAVKADMAIMTKGRLHTLDADFDGYGIAIDIGTTTVAAYMYSYESGECVDIESVINPQTSFGVDVISRIKYCRDKETGLSEQHDAIITALNKLIETLCTRQNIDVSQVSKMSLTGNTTMLCLAAKVDPSPMGVSPFEMPFGFGNIVNTKEIDLIGDADVYLSQCMSSFVGGDITSAILSSGMLKEDVSLLLDIGTNGEVALNAHGKILASSTAAGPAFEGAELSCGMAAVAGAINSVYTIDGKIEYTTIGDIAPTGICGSGVIDTLALMKTSGAMDETGYIEEGAFTEEVKGMSAFKICDGVYISQEDVRNIQTAKSAIAAGMLAIINSAGLEFEDVQTLYLAGGFGNYMNEENAAHIGLLPPGALAKLKNIGNAAGAGAGMTLGFGEYQEESKKIAQASEHVELAMSAYFMEKYVDCMMF
ncbi:MAG: DUF4445 domain-containing protein [Clostridia bacterium]|jgi:uncharacterized 2Fe-2S/4Fe-4S cluster protein (DUF4445 family)|nr:DUF4445 domain-containing protein [Clostridia bacterium]MBT7123071.1 DUF4445 domain-containing protein [Clostridia bacterium]